MTRWALVPAFLSAACGSGDSADPRVVSDSAGVEIVDVRPGRDTLDLRSHASLSLSIGVEQGEAEYELAGVIGAVRLSNGSLVIANAGTDELRFFTPDGEYTHSSGRDGEGPGEFRDIGWIGALGDSIVVYDGSLARISVLGPDGAFVRSVTLTGVVLPYVVGVVNDTLLAAWQWLGADPEQPGVYPTPTEFGVVSLHDGRFTAFGQVQGTETSIVMYQGRATPAFRPFGRAADVAAGGGLIFVLTQDETEAIRVYDPAGRLIRIIRLDVPRVTVDDARANAWIDSWMVAFPTSYPQVEARWRYGFANTPRPDDAPVFRSLEVSASNEVCAERYPLRWVDPAHYWCFSPDGHLTRIIELPPGLLRLGPYPHFDAQLEIAARDVIGVWRDSLDVPTVRGYMLN